MPHHLLLIARAHALAVWLRTGAESRLGDTRRRAEAGQATAEYALVLLGAAALALLVVAWAARSNRVGRLLDAVFDQLLRRAS